MCLCLVGMRLLLVGNDLVEKSVGDGLIGMGGGLILVCLLLVCQDLLLVAVGLCLTFCGRSMCLRLVGMRLLLVGNDLCEKSVGRGLIGMGGGLILVCLLLVCQDLLLVA